MHSSFIAPLVFLVLCIAVAEGESLAGKRTEALALSVDKEGAEQGPKEKSRSSGSGEAIRVLWRVSGFVLGPRAAMDRTEAEKMIAKSLDIRGDRIVFDRKACHGIKFKKTKEKLSEYLERAYSLTPKDLGLSDQPIEMIETDCSLPGFKEYLRLSDRRLVIQVKGVFFFFDPNVTY